MTDLDRMKLASPEIANWFCTELTAAMTDLNANQRRQQTMLGKRQGELKGMQNRLLNAYLVGAVDEATYTAKQAELKCEGMRLEESLATTGKHDPDRNARALSLFDWTQNAADIWRGSNNAVRREVLDLVCLNRTLTDVNLVTEKRKPFDVFAERLESEESRDNCRIFEPWTPARDAFATAFFVQREPHLNELWAMSEDAA